MSTLRVFRYGYLVGLQDFAGIYNPFTFLGGYIFRVVSQGVFFAMLGLLMNSPGRLEFLLVGQAVVVGATNATWAMYGSSNDRQDGTYPLLVIAPSSMLPALMGRTAVWILSGLVSSLLAFVFLFLVFEFETPWPEVLLIAPLVLLTCTASFTLALFIGALLTRVPQAGTLMINVVSVGLIAVCGVSVPVEFWPAWLEAFANLIPLTHGLKAVRIVLDQGEASEALLRVGYVLVLGAFWLLVSFLTLDRMTNAGRADGSIEFIPT